jgi:hypothetical protein
MQKWRGPPGEGRADPKHVQAAGWNVSDYAGNYDDAQPFVTLGDAAHMALAALWWRMRRDGVRLPAELGVISIRGGRQ